ncbi:MAG: hypothetical protein JO127_02705 [Caulobacteraceae bacterium]|nr:hypothetical protein [Caulobacteraceae bacterium]
MTDFDPSETSKPLSAPTADLKAQIVICIRNTLIPAPHDYRVLTEMGLPLFIKAHGRVLQLATSGGQLQASMFDGAALTPVESQAVSVRLALMEASIRAGATPSASGVDLIEAYAPADLSVLLGIMAKAGIPEGLDFAARQMPETTFASCAAGTKAAFIQAVDAHLQDQEFALRADMASGFEPAFTHGELTVLDHVYQLRPMLLAPTPNSPPVKAPTPAEEAEADALGKNPVVVRFVGSFGKAMTPMMEHVAQIMTAALHETCPGMQDQQFNSIGLHSETRGPGLPPP